jgi:hypothetical protein
MTALEPFPTRNMIKIAIPPVESIARGIKPFNEPVNAGGRNLAQAGAIAEAWENVTPDARTRECG